MREGWRSENGKRKKRRGGKWMREDGGEREKGRKRKSG